MKGKLGQIRKNYLDLFHRSDARWKKLLFPYPIDEEEQTAEEVKWRKTYIFVVWVLFGFLFLVAEVVLFPHWWKMFVAIGLTLILLATLSTLLQNFQVKKSPAGRKSPTPIASFAECFTDEAFYHKVDSFISQAHDAKMPMSSVECHALLEHVLKNSAFLISDVSMNRLSNLIIKDYGPSGLLSFTTARAVSKAKVTKGDRERIKRYFSR